MAILKTLKKQINHLVKPTQDVVSNLHYQKKSTLGSNSQSFEGLSQVSYSHGLEKIYTIENVDLTTVRRIQGPENTPLKNTSEQLLPIPYPDLPDQLELNLGDEYCEKMDPFVKSEPIHVLGLSQHTEKCLLEHGKHRIKDLIHADLREFVFLKGMGQGHIDEIKQKLCRYLEGKSLEPSYTIDFTSWLRSHIASLDRKKIFVSLERFELSELISLTPAESVEVRRLNLEKKQEWIEEMHALMRSQMKQQTLLSDIQKLVDVYVKPWIWRRGGIAKKSEILERLYQINEIPKFTEPVLNYYGAIYFNEGFPLDPYLYSIDDNLYASDLSIAESYRKVLMKAASYFYNPYIRYPLHQLITFIEREEACQWVGYPNGFLEKALRLSSGFRVRKVPSGLLEIYLA